MLRHVDWQMVIDVSISVVPSETSVFINHLHGLRPTTPEFSATPFGNFRSRIVAFVIFVKSEH
jgi:hypothetical protein